MLSSLSRTSSSFMLRHRQLPLLTRPFFSSSPSPAKEDRSEGITKGDLVKEIAETHDLSTAKSERIITGVLESIMEAVSDNKAVRLSNFGRFESYESSARMGRNPSTGEEITIPAKMRIRFKPYSSFKKTANGES